LFTTSLPSYEITKDAEMWSSSRNSIVLLPFHLSVVSSSIYLLNLQEKAKLLTKQWKKHHMIQVARQ
jgi:hypothetical protein